MPSETITLETNAMELMQRFDRLPAAVQTGILGGIKRALLATESSFLSNPGVNMTGGRSGLASRLTSYAVKDSGDQVDGAIGFRKTAHFPYELSQEFGAKAKAGGAMTVPLSPLAKALSQRGIGAREGFGEGRLQLIKIASGAYLVETKPGRRGKANWGELVWHYKLIKSLKPRMRFRESVRNSIPMISEQISQGAKEGMAKV